MRGQILKRNDGDGFFIIACDGVNMPLCVRANVIQISDAGGEIADIQRGTNQAISIGALNGAGTYVAWQSR